MSWNDDVVCADAAVQNTYQVGKSIQNLYTRGSHGSYDDEKPYDELTLYEQYRRLHWPYVI